MIREPNGRTHKRRIINIIGTFDYVMKQLRNEQLQQTTDIDAQWMGNIITQ